MNICIIGGGFTGLAAATELVERGCTVLLLERSAQLGGLAAGFKEPGWSSALESFYHHWFASDQSVIRYARQWNAADGLMFCRPLSVVETASSGFVPLDSAWSLLRFPELSLFQKLRMGAALCFLRFTRNWRSLEKVTVQQWCRRYMGQAGYHALWEPLLVGKFGSQWAERVNMAWLWARLYTRTARLGTYRGGFQALVDKAEVWLQDRGVRVTANCGPVGLVADPGGGWSVRAEDSTQQFDAVLVAASPQALSHLVPDLEEGHARRLLGQPALGAQVVILSLDRALGQRNIYWYGLRKTDNSPFVAVIEHTQFVPASEFGGETLVYLASYVEPGGMEWRRDDRELVALAVPCLQRIRPDFDPCWINRHWIFRTPYAQPIPEVNASEQLLPIAVPGHPGLFHASMAHVYPWDRGTNFALGLGAHAAREIMSFGSSRGKILPGDQ